MTIIPSIDSFISKQLTLTLLIVCYSVVVNSQINSNFEAPIQFDTSNFIDNWDAYLKNASGNIEQAGAYEGKAGLCVEPLDENLQYSIDAAIHIAPSIFKQENVSFNLKINTQEASVDSIVFKIAQSKYKFYESVKIEPTITPGIEGWSNYELPLELTGGNVRLVKFIFRVYAKSGHVKVDNFQITSNSQVIPTDKWRTFDDKFIVKELQDLIIPLDDFVKSDILKNKHSIIGIGENSHGIEECKKLRYDIIKEQNKQSKVNILIEQPPIELCILNHELVGKAEKQIHKETKQLFFVYHSSQFHNLIKEVSDNSLTNTIEFHGNDIQYANYSNKDLESNQITLTSIEQKTIDRSIEVYSNQNSSKDFMFDRDSTMALNTIDLLKTNSKNVIFAHNNHIRNGDYSAGSWLHKELGKKYLNIGVLVGNGTHYTNDNYLSKKIHPMPPTLPHSYESIFAQVSNEAFVIDTRKIKNNNELHNQLCPRSMKSAGSVSYFSKVSHMILDLTEEFDFIVFFPKVNAMSTIPTD